MAYIPKWTNLLIGIKSNQNAQSLQSKIIYNNKLIASYKIHPKPHKKLDRQTDFNKDNLKISMLNIAIA